jgi:anti-sigma factor RsiW
MTERSQHPHDELHLLLDGRLDADARARVEAHLAGCELCRQELEALRWTKRVTRHAAGIEEGVPNEVRDRVLAALDEVDLVGVRRARRAARIRFLAPALGLALAATIAVVLLLGRSQDPVAQVEGDLERYAASTLTLERLTGSPQELEQFFAGQGLDFTAHVYDFEKMRFTLRGGRVETVSGRRGALFVYSSPDGGHLVCQMYRGDLAGLPKGFERRDLDGIEFRLYRRGTVTLVAWMDGPVVCMLASDGDPDQALQFAHAKALAART